MINNYFCPDCNKYSVCAWVSAIEKFSEDKKKRIGVTVNIETCEEYEKVKDEDEE